MSRLTFLTRVVAATSAVMLVACFDTTADSLRPGLPAGDMFQSYVAIGNSITAGFQSNGINDSTQRQSYARLLANAMGTQYHYASLNMPGCTPPIANAVTGAFVANAASNACALRATSSVSDVLNNVAVPGARVLDPISATTVASNPLTQFILGGKTQVQRALDARPTFVSIWIGNNDVLNAGLSGFLTPVTGVSPGIVSTQAAFQASYDEMLKQLTDSMLKLNVALKGVLIGVVQVSNAAQMSSIQAIQAAPTLLPTLSAATGKAVTLNPNCVGSTSLINLVLLVPQIKSGGQPAEIACSPTGNAAQGAIFVLDAAEQTTLTAAINGYNGYIQQKAQALGWAYYDPNTLLAAQRAAGTIPPIPNLTSATAPFGSLISLDGIHPSGAAHILIANDLITAINAKYGTSLPKQ